MSVLTYLPGRRLRAIASLYLAIFVAPYAFATNASVGTDGQRLTCNNYFAQLEKGLDKKNVQTTLYDDLFYETKPTLEIVGSSPGRHAGKRVQLNRSGAVWGSYYTSVGFDPQGDPRWFIELVGRDAGEFFGFRIINDRTAEIPDFAEFTGALSAVNQELKLMGKEAVPITFYPMPEGNNVAVGKYVDRFLDDYGLPVAPDGNHLIHDMSFHSGAIFFPRRFLEEVSARTEYSRNFAEFLKKKYAGEGEELFKAAQRFSYLIKLDSTGAIDLGTAILGTQVAGYVNAMKYNMRSQHMKDYLRKIVMRLLPDLDGRAPLAPKNSLADELRQVLSVKFNPNKAIDTKKTADALTSLPIEQVLSDLEEFSMSYRSERFPNFNPRRPALETQGDVEDFLEELCHEITTRRADIRAAVQAIQARAAGN